MSNWTELGKFDDDAVNGVPSVLLAPAEKLQTAKRKPGTWVMVTAPGLLEAHAVPLRLRAVRGATYSVLHTSDWAAIASGETATSNDLKVRSLSVPEKLGLLSPPVWALVISSFIAALLALAAALVPAHESVEVAAQRARTVEPAITTLERDPQALAAAEVKAATVQRALTHPPHRTPPGLRRRLRHLGEMIEDGRSQLGSERSAAQQASTDVHAWRIGLQAEAVKSNSSLRSALDTAVKIAAAVTALVAAFVAFSQALPGAPRR